MENVKSNKKSLEQWASRWGYIAAALGMAIGTGNIWRFPREVAQNGGSPFLFAWTIAMLFWAVPIIAVEMVIGRYTRKGTVLSFKEFVGKRFTWMGTWIGLVSFMIMAYYSVVTGWCLKYLGLALTGAFNSPMTHEQTLTIWTNFNQDGSQTLVFHALSLVIAGSIVLLGVNKGIEKASKIMIPLLFLMLVFLAIRVAFIPGAIQGYQYLFEPQWAFLLDVRVWVEAFTQVSWSTGAGWGLLLTYAIYTKPKEDVGGNALMIGVGDNVGALLAGLVVIPSVFALSPSFEAAQGSLLEGGTGLTFVYLAQVFSTMDIGLISGGLLALVFFGALTLAALTSLIPMIEVTVVNLMDLGWKRSKATLLVLIGGFLVGMPSALNSTFFSNQDTVTGYALWLSGLFFIFAIVKHGVDKVRKQYINTDFANISFGKWFNASIYIAPLFSLILLYNTVVDMLGLEPSEIWKITGTDYSLGTLLFQFAIYLIIGISTMPFFNEYVRR